MSDNIENKAARGSISQIILTALSTGNKYGYEICKDIEKITKGKLILKQPSLYSCLRRMEEQGLISSFWEDSSLGGKRHYYSLTEAGKDLYLKNKDLWAEKDLLGSLPENIENIDENLENIEQLDDNDKNSEENNLVVANQENLFNLAKNQENIKKITEDNSDDSNAQSFLQFDFFEQNIKHVKNTEKVDDNITSYVNKFSSLDNHSKEIQPIIQEDVVQSFEIQMQSNNESLESINNIVNDVSNEDNDMEISTSYNDFFEEVIIKKEDIIVSRNFNPDNKNNDSKIIWEVNNDEINDNSNTSPLFDTDDYKSLIGELYNNSKLKDPYEQNKFHTFKEIFPSSQLKKEIKTDNVVENNDKTINELVKSNKDSNINCDDIKMLNNLYNLQGINIKIHKDLENKRQNKVYTDKNKLNMVSAWIITLIALFEIIGTYYLLKNNNLLQNSQTIIYFLSTMMILCFCVIQTLENIFDRFKLVKIKKRFNKVIVFRFLITLLLVVAVFAINLSFGMSHLLQREFLSFWLIPCLMLSNILVYTIVYYSLLNSKSFNS